ncbi:BPSS1780 family membrane protein [Halochromatium sp.]
MAQSFKVVFTGALAPTANAEQAVRDFATVFKVSEEQARSLIFDGQSRVLKTDVDADNARRYQEVLEEIGLQSRIEPMEAQSGLAAGEAEPRSSAPEAAPEDHSEREAGTGVSGHLRSDQAEQRVEPSQPTDTAAEDPSRQRLAPVKHPAGHGWQWIARAWQQFKAQPGVWLAAVALVYLVTFVLSLVPVVGSLATMILGPVFAGGLMLGAQSQERQGRLRVSAGFEGFSSHGGQLALIGLLYLVGLFLVFVVAGLVLMATGVLSAGSMEALSSNDPEVVADVLGPGIGLVLLVLMLAMVPLLMLYWFAPALVALEGMGAVEAMRMSFRACWRNMLPFVVYGLALMFILVGASLILGIVSALLAAVSEALMVALMLLMIPLMLVFAALVVLSIYSAYRDVFNHAARSHGTLAF